MGKAEMAVNDEVLCGTRRHFVYMDTAKLLCAWRSQGTLMTNALASEKDGKIIGHLLQKVSGLCTSFWREVVNIHCSMTIVAVKFFFGLIIRHA